MDKCTYGKRLEETENKAQAHHLAKVLDFLKEPRAEGYAAERESSWEVPISGQGYTAAMCVYGQGEKERYHSYFCSHLQLISLLVCKFISPFLTQQGYWFLLVLSFHRSNWPLSTSV